jgi:lipid II:glycine glycyltransferase (peptidoglycan interpeptide bridge formation enzyme)
MDYRELDGSENLLQSGFWGEFKKTAGWFSRAFLWRAGELEGRFLILERRFPGGLSMAYVPYGPELPEAIENDPDSVSRLLSLIGRELKTHLSRNCFIIRFDLTGGTRAPVGSTEVSTYPAPLTRPLRKAPYRVQPQDTVLLNLEKDEESLLSDMHKKTRYNIRLASKKGVVIHRFTGEDALQVLPDWYEIYRETGRRDGISLHAESYYRRLFSEAESYQSSRPSISLYTATHETDLLAGIIIANMSGRAVYMYGASSGLKRELMPNQLLQWTAIRDAGKEGAREYDFFGIPPADNPSHPMHGLWRFKTGFGGEIVHYRGAWDFPLKGLVYAAYRVMERMRGGLAAFRKPRAQ